MHHVYFAVVMLGPKVPSQSISQLLARWREIADGNVGIERTRGRNKLPWPDFVSWVYMLTAVYRCLGNKHVLGTAESRGAEWIR